MKTFFVICISLALIVGCAGSKKNIVQPEYYTQEEVDAKFDSLRGDIAQSIDLVVTNQIATDSLAKTNRQEFQNYRKILTAIKIPDTILFCGYRIPMEISDVRQRIEKQIYLTADDQAQVLLYLLRAQQFFPIIEEMLAADSMPDDLKYIAVIESALKPTARSRAKAQGFWQFVYWTAKRYKVNATKHVDMRNDLEVSTQGAIAYFQKLYKQFDGNWPLVLAAYNMGENGLAKKIKEQGISDYFQLVLPAETEEYVFRAAAVKLILEDPARFDIPPEMINYWAETAKDTLSITINNRLMVKWVADWCQTTYRNIKLLNPEVKNHMWDPGRYVISIPCGTREMFFEGLTAIKRGDYKP